MNTLEIIEFEPTTRIGFINNVQIAVDMVNVLKALNLIKVKSMVMGDNKLYIYLE